MNLMQLLRQMLSLDKKLTKQQKEVIQKEINIQEAIHAHQDWKHRLELYIADNMSETLEVGKVSSDGGCVLGKWIYGTARERIGDNDVYNDLKEAHAVFHRTAGQIIQLTQNGQKRNAVQMLNKEYRTASSNVLEILRGIDKVIK